MDWEFYALQYIQQDVIINQRLTVTNFIQTSAKNNSQSSHLFPFPRILRKQKNFVENFTTEIIVYLAQQ